MPRKKKPSRKSPDTNAREKRAKGRALAKQALSAFAKDQKEKGETALPEDDVITVVLSVQLLRRDGEVVDQIAEWLQNRVLDLVDVRDVEVRRVFDPFQPEYVCEKCGCKEVQSATWVELNTDRVCEDFGTFNYDGSTFCPNCDLNESDPHQRIKFNGPDLAKEAGK